jgi:hypothetical protein
MHLGDECQSEIKCGKIKVGVFFPSSEKAEEAAEPSPPFRDITVMLVSSCVKTLHPQHLSLFGTALPPLQAQAFGM